MEPTTTHSVHRGPAWNREGGNSPTAAVDPLAFFDLIMSTAQKMSASAGNRNDFLNATGPADPAGTQSASTNSHGQDGQNRGTVPAYESSPSPTAPTEPTSVAESNDPAAVTEFSEQHEEDKDVPDDAAQATAAAAAQQQLLGPSETLPAAKDPLATEVAAETGKPLPVKPDTIPAGTDALADSENNLPLDTSAVATEETAGATAPHQAADTLPSEADTAAKEKGNDQAKAMVEMTEADPPHSEIEGDPAEKTRNDRSGLEKAEAGQKLTAAEGEENAGDSGQRESSRDGETSANSTQDKPTKPKPSAPEASPPAATANAPSDVSTALKPGQESAPPPAAASAVAQANAAPQAGSSSGEPGTAGITSLLQRGLQRGTLQKASEGRPSAGLDAKQQVRLVNRVARAVETTPPGQAIRIRLNPSELGALKVEIKIENGNMIARIEAENATTRQVLLENLPQLRERLAENNIQVQQFDVDLMGQDTPTDRGTSHLGDNPQERGESRSSRQEGSERANPDENPSEDSSVRRVNKEAERESRNLNVTV